MPFFLSGEQCHIAAMTNANQTKDATSQGYRPLGMIVALFIMSIASSILPQLRPDTSTIALLMTAAILGLALCLRVVVSHEHARDRRIVITGLKRPEFYRIVSLCALFGWGLSSETIGLRDVVGWLSLLPLVYLFDMMFEMRHSTHYALGLRPVFLTGLMYLCWPGQDPSAVGLLLAVLVCTGVRHQPGDTAARRVVRRIPVHAVVIAMVCVFLMYADINQARGFLLSYPWHESGVSVLVLTLTIGLLQPQGHILATVAAAIIFAAIDHLYQLTGLNSVFPVGVFPAGYLLVLGVSWPGSRESTPSTAHAFLTGLIYAVGCLILLAVLTKTSAFFDGGDHTRFAPYLAAGLTPLLTLAMNPRQETSTFQPGRYSMALACLAGIIWSTHHDFSARVDGALIQASTRCAKDSDTCDRFVGLFMNECEGPNTVSRPLSCRQVATHIEELGCTRGIKTRCRTLGRSKLRSAEPSTQREGRRLMSTACTDGLIEACIDLARFLEENDPQAHALRRRVSRIACDQGDRLGCELLGFSMLDTAKTANEYKAASEKLYFACQVHRPRACTKLAEMLLIGQFGKTSPARARILLDGACRRGHEPACERLRNHKALNGAASPTQSRQP